MWPSHHSPNVHANIPAWLVARGNQIRVYTHSRKMNSTISHKKSRYRTCFFVILYLFVRSLSVSYPKPDTISEKRAEECSSPLLAAQGARCLSSKFLCAPLRNQAGKSRLPCSSRDPCAALAAYFLCTGLRIKKEPCRQDPFFMQKKGLEPSLYCYNRHLKPARLPIPPLLRTEQMLFYIFPVQMSIPNFIFLSFFRENFSCIFRIPS